MRRCGFVLLTILACGFRALDAQTQVTLSPLASPSVGQPGVTTVNVTGSNFPDGTILPANVTVSLTPSSGGSTVTTAATAVTTIFGSTRRVTFTIPGSITVLAPTAHNVSISGSTTAGAPFSSSNSALLTIDPLPSISGVSPNNGQQGQTLSSVTITGQFTNFVQGATQASFGAGIAVGGGTPGAFGPITVVNATTATATLSIAIDAPPGTRTVTLVTGTEQETLANGFTVTTGSPTILSVNPNSGQQGQTLPGVVITGAFTHFTQTGSAVTFSNTGVVASNVQVVDSTHLTATLMIAANAAGSSNVTVVTGSETATGVGLFMVGNGTPVITSVSPNSGPQGQTLAGVVITGAFTHFTLGTPTVTSSNPGVTTSAVQVTDNTHLTVTLTIGASAATGAVNLTVVTESESATGTGVFAVTPGVPILLSANPISGQQGQQNLVVVITGQFTHFVQGTTAASFGAGITVVSLAINSATNATAALNIDAAASVGSRNVTMTTNMEVVTLPGGFTVSAGIPVITSLNPNSGQQGQTLPGVVITGAFTHFTQGTPTVSFGNPGVVASDVLVTDNTHLSVTLTIAAGAATGASNVMVVTGSETASRTGLFTIAPGTPIITSVNPNMGQQGQTLTGVMINGAFTHFTQGNHTITFSNPGVVASNIQVADNTHMSVTLTVSGAAAVGAANVTVTSGIETASGTNVFTVTNGTPMITQVIPNSGQQGQTLTGAIVTGAFTHFTQGAPAVTFSNGGVVASNIQVTDDTHLSVTLTIADNAATGASNVTVVTGTETASGNGLFSVTPGTPSITVVPNSAQQGAINLAVSITGKFTHWVEGTTTVNFGPDIAVTNTTVTSATNLTLVITISASATPGPRACTITTGSEVIVAPNCFTILPGIPTISQVNPNSGQQGQTLTGVVITGALTHFTQGLPTITFSNTGVVASNVQVTDNTHLTVKLTIAGDAATGPSNVTVVTGTETATGTSLFTVTSASGPTITSFNPTTASAGTLVSVNGTGFVPTVGAVPQVTLAKQGGGTIPAVLSSFASSSLSFVVPTGAMTGLITVSVAGNNGSSASPLAITTSSSFTLSAAPGAVELIQGQDAGISVRLASSNGFGQLATLSVAGLPSGVTASFKPQSITTGQTSIVSLTAPASQPTGLSTLTFSASATVDGLPLSQSATAQLSITAPTTSFIGRTVVSDALQTPIAGVTVTFLGKDGNGGMTGCIGTTVSDAAGNFLLKNLAPNCVGPQLVGFDGTTATAPAGRYAGVNIVYPLASGQVTPAPLLVHLPRIDDKETFLVQNPAPMDQSYSYKTVPGLSLTVYAGTTFTMPDGSRPNPFPLAGIQVPIDRLPDVKQPVPTMVMVFIVAFQPANATADQPVAVYYPNTINTAPGVNMVLMTLDPTRGTMVPYGTGTVATDGTQIVPDLIPSGGGKRYGIVHFDWHSPMPPPDPPTKDRRRNRPCTAPRSSGQCPVCPDQRARTSNPVEFSSGVESYEKTDIAFGGTRGIISIDRLYRTLSGNSGPFGIGGNHNYGYSLDSLSPQTASLINLIMPDYDQFPFSRQTDGTLRNQTDPAMLGAVMFTSSDGSVRLRWKDGMVFQFMPPGATFPLLQSITDSKGNTISLTRNPARPKQITQISDPVGRSLVLAYDVSDRITSITDPIGRTVLYSYNAFGSLASVTDPAGGVTKYDYQAANLLMRETDPRNIVVMENTYDANGRVIQQKQADGGITTMAYTLANPMAPTSPVVKTVVTDPLGRQTVYRFNTVGYVTDSIDSLGQSRTFERSGANLVTAAKGDGGCTACGSPAAGDMSFTYDPATGNLLSQTDALGNKTQYTYEPVFNRIATVTDALGFITQFIYDSQGNLTSRTDANNHTTLYKYDPFGELVQTTDPVNQSTKFTYDSFGNLIMITDALAKQTQFSYDAISRQTEVDALGRRSATSYDKLSRVVQQTDAKSGVTIFQYDGAGNLVSVTDARGKKTAFTYDGMNRLATRTTPLGKTDSRLYDFNGNLTQFTDRRGQFSTFAYDELNRLTGETYLDSTVTRTYDAPGRLARVDDSISGVFTYAYDLTGQVLSSVGPFGAVQFVRDQLGRVKNRQVVGQAAIAYSYDPVGNLFSAAMPLASVGYTYNERNQPSTTNRLNGVTSQYAYDPVGRLTSIAHIRGGSPLATFVYTNDDVGQRSSLQNSSAQALLTQPAVATYDDGNRLLTRGTTSYTYDDNGNLGAEISPSGTTAYTWDSRNRLKSITTPVGQTTTFQYDFVGILLQQKDVGPSLNLTQIFVLDELTNIAYVSRSDGDQYSVLAGQSIDEHLAAIHLSGSIEYGLADAINSTIATVDEGGVVKGHFLYEPYGQTTSTGSAYPFQYTGRVPVSTGLYYYRARFYSPGMGRFISEDPSGFAGGINLYSYTINDPINFNDPTGLDRYDICNNYGFVLKALCKKCVDAGCNSSPGAALHCCEVDRLSCFNKLDPTDPDYKNKAEKCTFEYTQCASKLKKKK
jgi:RHS repeat-associated protein